MDQAVINKIGQVHSFDLPSGAKLSISIAPFRDSWELMRATLETLKGANVDTEDLKKDAKTLAANPAAFSMLFDRIIEFATSPSVEAAIWKCATRSLYIPADSIPEFPGLKVNPALFDNQDYGIQAREDFPRIASAVLEVNCKPFLAQVLSMLKQK